MSAQLDWCEPKRTRRSDPATSHIAAERNRATLDSQAEQVLAIIRRLPGSTACELAKEWTVRMDFGSKRTAVSRRTPELERDGKIRRGSPRECSVKGSLQTTWYEI